MHHKANGKHFQKILEAYKRTYDVQNLDFKRLKRKYLSLRKFVMEEWLAVSSS